MSFLNVYAKEKRRKNLKFKPDGDQRMRFAKLLKNYLHIILGYRKC